MSIARRRHAWARIARVALAAGAAALLLAASPAKPPLPAVKPAPPSAKLAPAQRSTPTPPPGGSPAPRSFGEALQAKRYLSCMEQARTAPKDAVGTARSWSARGGGLAAEHCEAVGMIGLGRDEDAAKKLFALAVRVEQQEKRDKLAPSVLPDQLLAQAANAWLMAGNTEKAFVAQSLALTRRPDSVELLIDRSVTLASDGRYWEAIDDLNRAIKLQPEHADALVYRATAYRKLDSLVLAEEDIVRALHFAPGHPDGLLEKGNILRLQGDTEGAKAAWLKVLDVSPNSPAADAARQNLDRLK